MPGRRGRVRDRGFSSDGLPCRAPGQLSENTPPDPSPSSSGRAATALPSCRMTSRGSWHPLPWPPRCVQHGWHCGSSPVRSSACAGNDRRPSLSARRCARRSASEALGKGAVVKVLVVVVPPPLGPEIQGISHSQRAEVEADQYLWPRPAFPFLIMPYKTINLKYYNSAGEQSQQSEQCPIPPVFEMLGEGIGCGIAVEFVTERGRIFSTSLSGSRAARLVCCLTASLGARVTASLLKVFI